ncbi:type IV pilin [Natrialbaceae archaeon A-CW1-1]
MSDARVSPVIGVILMVVITVILATVIAAFVLDLGQATDNSGGGVTVNTGDDALSNLVLAILSGVILLLVKKVWNLDSEVNYLKGRIEAENDNLEVMKYNEEENQSELESSKQRNA